VALAVLSIVTVGAANAQGGGGGRRGGGMFGMRGGLGMLQISDVQKELKMTPDQIAKISTKQQETRDQMRSVFQGGGGPGGDPAEMQQRMAQVRDIQDKAVADILNADQLKRYHQLELQQQGTMALSTRKDVQDALKLTDDQKTKIQDIRQKAMDDMRSAMQGVDPQSMTDEDRQKMRTKMQESQKATNAQIEAVLTPDQQKQWKDMQGAPFKFPPMQPGRGGFGGGRQANPAT
jgi:hypothetical protein